MKKDLLSRLTGAAILGLSLFYQGCSIPKAKTNTINSMETRTLSSDQIVWDIQGIEIQKVPFYAIPNSSPSPGELSKAFLPKKHGRTLENFLGQGRMEKVHDIVYIWTKIEDGEIELSKTGDYAVKASITPTASSNHAVSIFNENQNRIRFKLPYARIEDLELLFVASNKTALEGAKALMDYGRFPEFFPITAVHPYITDILISEEDGTLFTSGSRWALKAVSYQEFKARGKTPKENTSAQNK